MNSNKSLTRKLIKAAKNNDLNGIKKLVKDNGYIYEYKDREDSNVLFITLSDGHQFMIKYTTNYTQT